jgi:hypothetical protein
MVSAKDLEVADLIPQAQFMVSLKFVPMAGSADALKVFPAVWIACPQSSDEPCWHNVVGFILAEKTSKVRQRSRFR